MFKVTIIKLKDIVKIGVILILIYVFSRFMVKKVQLNNYFNFNGFNTYEFSKKVINEESSIIKNISQNNKEENVNNEEISKIHNIIKVGSNIFNIKEIANQPDKENNNEETNITQNLQEQNKTEETKSLSTQVVTKNPLQETFNREYNGVKIKNETDFELTDNLLSYDNLEINKNNILIFHTHTCESYSQSENYKYEPTGNYRTTDLNYSVARVGDELSNYFTGFGFNVKHNKTYHDYPAYTGSYSRSFKTVQDILKDFNSDIIIDLHRDAIGSREDYAPLVKIGEDYCAQVMFVMGTNGGGLNHPNWETNLKFSIKIQQKANEMFPGLFKPIVLRNSRYNQNLGKAACIIEVGATGNTLDQTLCSMKYLSRVFNAALK